MNANHASLRRWRPRSWNREEEIFDTFDTAAGIAEPPVLVELDDPPENRDLVTLHRAAERNGLAERLFHRVPITEATPWHDGLQRIVAMRIEYRLGRETVKLQCPRDSDEDNRVDRATVDAIEVHATVRRGRDERRERTLVLPTDFAVADEYEPDPTRARILLAAGAELGIEELAALIHDAIFEPGEDRENDSIGTQLEDAREDAHYAAYRLLLDPATAETERIRYAVQRRIAHLIPDGTTVRITRHPGVEAVEVEVSGQ